MLIEVTLAVIVLGAADTTRIDAPIVPASTALEEPGRYESSRSFDDTVKYYARVFRNAGGVRWRNIVNLPAVKAKHVQSVRQKTRWEGINIYEMQGKVRFFIIPRPVPPTPPKKAKKKSGRRRK